VFDPTWLREVLVKFTLCLSRNLAVPVE